MILHYSGAFRLILHGRREGRENMAIDEVLLEQAVNSPPVIRFYGFSRPTLSLGRFQHIKHTIHFDNLNQDGVTLVRRPTGGQAVLHDAELTYAVILNRNHLEPFKKREIYSFVADMLLSGLKELGIQGISSRSRQESLYNPDCFASTGEYEITNTEKKKLIGSAQIITRSASLQHGSIPLNNSYKRIHRYLNICDTIGVNSGSLADELERNVSFEEAINAFAKAFESRLNTEPGNLSEKEIELCRKKLRLKYMDDKWNLKY